MGFGKEIKKGLKKIEKGAKKLAPVLTTALPLAGQAGGVIQTFQAISGK